MMQGVILTRSDNHVNLDLMQYITRKCAGVEWIDDLNAKKRAKVKAAVAELSAGIVPPWSEEHARAPHAFPYSPDDVTATGPTRPARDVLDMAGLILLTLPWTLMAKIARFSTKFACEDDVRAVPVEGRVRNRYSRRKPSDPPTTAYRKRCKRKWFGITQASTMVYLGIRMLAAAYKVRSQTCLWGGPHGISMPIVRNAMSQAAFEQHRQYMRWNDRETQPNHGQPGFDRLWSVRPLMTHFSTNWPLNWTGGRRVAIDESMICYKGKRLDFVQYMPAKPIKHGIKVYALCCSETGYCLAFEIFQGKRHGIDNSPRAVVDRLLSNLGWEADREAGRTLFTDNWYTSTSLAAHLEEAYNMALVGTFRLTKKKGRTGADFPFSKPSNPAVKATHRAWFRQASARLADVVGNAASKSTAWVTATIWKDKKCVGLLSTQENDITAETTQRRWCKEAKTYMDIKCPGVCKEYKDNMGGVDRFDKDIAQWGVHGQSREWANKVAWYLINANSVNDWKIATYYDKDKARDDFKLYCRAAGRTDASVSHARFRFQVDKAKTMIRIGLEKAVEDGECDDDGKFKFPWSRRQSPIPCDCGGCFHCKNGLTGKVQGVEPKRQARRNGQSCDQEPSLLWQRSVPGVPKCLGCRKRKSDHTSSGNSRNKAFCRCTGCNLDFCGQCLPQHHHLVKDTGDNATNDEKDWS